MIRRIFSTLPSFKTLTFHAGLNLVVAEKSPGASQQQTRNAAGKSSIVDIIRFLTGGDCDPDSLFRKEALVAHRFGVTLDVADHAVSIERSWNEPSKILVGEGNVDAWPHKPTPDEETGNLIISAGDLKATLGQVMFGLRDEPTGPWSQKYKPTFRSLLGYFLREERSGGFRNHAKTVGNAPRWQAEVNVSFLLGLDWTIPQRWQTVRDKQEDLKRLKKAAEHGVLGDIVGRSGDLRAELVLAEKRVTDLKGRISGFNILPEYRERDDEAAELTQRLGRLSDENTADKYLLKRLQDAFKSEAPPPMTDVEMLYQEAQVSIPASVARRFDEVRTFHESVIRNRKTYLEGEMSAAKTRISTRDSEMTQLQDRRRNIVAVLKSHGALDQLERLHEELARDQANVEVLRERFNIALKVEKGAAELRVEEGELALRLQQDYQEQNVPISEAILAFESISRQLYGRGGTFSPETSAKGPRFDVKIHAQDSPGISNMQVFCFDMMLMQLCSERSVGPGFLVHDSHVFDPVDKRQVASALKVGAEMAKKYSWQYIVTLNSDQIPGEHDRPEGSQTNPNRAGYLAAVLTNRGTKAMNNFSEKVSFIWSVADLLRGPCKPAQYILSSRTSGDATRKRNLP